MEDLELIGACTELGVHVIGASKGPVVIDANTTKKIKLVTCDNSNKNTNPKEMLKNLTRVNEFNTHLYNTVCEALDNNKIPLTIGGDHSMSIASALASNQKNQGIGIIWIDAHADFNTRYSTITGNIHGLPLAVITGYEEDYLRPFSKTKFINPHNAVIIGGIDIEPQEWKNIKDAGVTVISKEELREKGIIYVLDKAFKIASNNTQGVHISYDVDVIDPKVAPGVSIPAQGGLTELEAYQISKNLKKYKQYIKSIDLVEYNPVQDNNDKTLKIVLNILDDLKNIFPK